MKVNSDGKVWWESSRSEDEYFQPQTRVWSRNVCESLNSSHVAAHFSPFLSASSLPPLPRPSITISLSVLQIRQWKQWIWCLFLSLPVSPSPISLALSCSLMVTLLHTLLLMPTTNTSLFFYSSPFLSFTFPLCTRTSFFHPLLSLSVSSLFPSVPLFLSLYFYVISCSSCPIISLSEVVLTPTILLHTHW